MPDAILDKRPDGTALITLNRPESLNALGGDMVPLLGRYLDECEEDRSVRSIALTGAGRGFCAGGDVKNMAAGTAPGAGDKSQPNLARMLTESIEDLRKRQNSSALRLATIPKPTVALVNGPAAGAGLGLALSCDLRVCSDRANFRTAFKNIALSGDFGGSYFLQRLVGYGRALELYYTSAVIDAENALSLGIANLMVPHDSLLEEGLSFCAELASGPTSAYGRMKSNFNFSATARLSDALDHEAFNMRLGRNAPDFSEGTRSFVEKRAPRFTGE
ncbi:MAG TPA: enoyl-CoA hydratase-related protein [Dehalococcoidia bacterium]|nr:enoyl-CoA hydratase-related protein [Dehalococcoidia bacterium]